MVTTSPSHCNSPLALSFHNAVKSLAGIVRWGKAAYLLGCGRASRLVRMLGSICHLNAGPGSYIFSGSNFVASGCVAQERWNLPLGIASHRLSSSVCKAVWDCACTSIPLFRCHGLVQRNKCENSQKMSCCAHGLCHYKVVIGTGTGLDTIIVLEYHKCVLFTKNSQLWD